MARTARRVVPIAVLTALTAVGAIAFSLTTASADTAPTANPNAVDGADCRPVTTTSPMEAGTNGGADTASVSIKVQVRVLGGRLELGTNRVTIDLHRDHDRYVGRFDDVRFLDTRGTYGGWTLGASVASVEVDGRSTDANVRVIPDDVTVVNGFSAGLENPGPHDIDSNPSELARASAGCGAGIYSIGGAVEVALPDGVSGDDVTLGLDLHLT